MESEEEELFTVCDCCQSMTVSIFVLTITQLVHLCLQAT